MAKKSKRSAARRQAQRQHPRPGVQPPMDTAQASPVQLSPSPSVADLVPGGAGLGLDEVDDYATGSLPVPESDGPMPLPPPDDDEEAPEEPGRPQVAAATTAAAPAAAAATGAGGRRRVGRLDPSAPVAQRPGQRGRPGRPGSTAAMFEPLPPEEPAIPFDRVPYVPGDLRRVLVIAGFMVALVVAADFVVNAVVK
jgi:hypothetical protein